MRVALAPLVVILLLAAACGPTPPETNGNLTVPDGFTVEVAAAAPLVERPMIISHDDRGRLYVAESSGSNDKVQQQLIDRPHSILRLEDTDQDGVYDKRTVFADKMMLPEGVLWHDGSVYVGAPPVIWKLTDTDDDGVADVREEWFDAKTLTNCANDLHGPYLGRDGWIYWAKGAFAEQTYERPGREPFVTKAAHIFRRRPEGGPVEPVLTGGMDNPVEVAFSPEGERFITSTFIEHPRLGRRDGVLHAVYGGVYGKVHGVTDGHPMTGGFQEVMAHLGPAAPVGLSFYESAGLGPKFTGNLFATLFNMHKVIRLVLTPRGATFDAEEEDFLVSDSLDFHPTDVMEDADGSLLVVDTGAWYKICCPTSQLAKPDVLGQIYRIRRNGAERVKDPYGLALEWDAPASALIARLEDPRPAVVEHAIAALAKAKATEPLAAALDADHPVALRRNAVWALTRIDAGPAREAVRGALADSGASVQHAALHSVSVWRDTAAAPAVTALLGKSGPALQRAAAEALGRLGDPTAVPALLAATAIAEDEVLTHSLTYALIEIADPTATRAGLRAASAKTRRAALIALDQMRPRALPAADVLPLLSTNDPLLTPAAEWIAGQHPDWGGALAGYFQNRLSNATDVQREALAAQLVRFTADPKIQALLARTAASGQPAARLTALDAMAKAPLDELPRAWEQSLAGSLTRPEPVAAAAVAAARNLHGDEPRAVLDQALLRLASSAAGGPETRVLALEVVAGGLPELPAELFGFLHEHVAVGQAAAVRSAAARTLAKSHLSEQQLAALADTLPAAGPMELPRLVEAFGQGKSAELGAKWVAALQDAKGLASLRPDIVETAAASYPAEVQTAAAGILASRAEDRVQQRERLEKLLASLGEGDVRRGQAVFNSEEAACFACHAIGYEGGRVGPGLTKIGEIRSKRDLLEAVVYPSASFVRSYEPIVAVTEMDIYNGVTLEETDSHLLLATGPHEEVRLARADIEEVRPGTVSVMPSGLADQLSRQQLADLLAFLENTRWGVN